MQESIYRRTRKPDYPHNCWLALSGLYPVVEDRLSRDFNGIPTPIVTPDLLKWKAGNFAKDCYRYECGFRQIPVYPPCY